MPSLLWRVVEWHLSRHLTSRQLASTLGDLAEDHAKQAARIGRARAGLFVVREALSVAAAYRAQAAQERRSSRRIIAGGAWMDDARFAMRRVLRKPAASAVSIVTLASAIAAGAVTWSLLSALLLHPLPVAAPDRLVAVGVDYPSFRGYPARRSRTFVYPEYVLMRESGAFDGLAAGAAYEVRVGEPGGAVPQLRSVYFASHDYFQTLGVGTQLGRAFAARDDRRGAPLTAVLSDRYWRAAWNADPAVVGRRLTVLEQQATIIGVAPRGFRGLSLAEAPDLYLPLHAIGDAGVSLGNPGFNPFAEPVGQDPPRNSPSSWIRIVGRLEPGDSTDRVKSRLAVIVGPNAAVLTTPVNTAAIPEAVGAGMAPFTRLLAATVGLLVLIGCLTVGVLLLVRTESRRDELAMCLALGGTRAGLARGIVFEGALLTAAGVALALPLASTLFSGLNAFELPGRVEIELLELSLDRGVWLAVAACAALALTLMTLVAAVFGFSPSVADALRARAGGTPRVTRRRTRAALVTAQVATAVVLLAGAGLFARSLAAALTINTGFDASRIVTGTVSLVRYGYTGERTALFFDELRERLRSQPDIEAVSLIETLGSMGPGGFITVDGIRRRFPSDVVQITIDDHYFTTLGLPVLEGRAFSRQDVMDAPPVVMVSESYGRALAGGASPIGLRITDTVSTIGKPPIVRQVVGVVPDVITNVGMTAPLTIYFPRAQQRFSFGSRTLVMKARAASAPVVRAATTAVTQIDPLVQPAPILTMEERLGQQMNPQRLGRFVLGALGGIALLLAMLGAYVLAESLSSGRRRELGIRAALGASRVHLGGLVLVETGRLVGVGLAAGMLLTWCGAGTIRSFLFRVEPLDPATLGAVAAALLVVSLAVSLRPALDAASVDLAETLHNE